MSKLCPSTAKSWSVFFSVLPGTSGTSRTCATFGSRRYCGFSYGRSANCITGRCKKMPFLDKWVPTSAEMDELPYAFTSAEMIVLFLDALNASIADFHALVVMHGSNLIQSNRKRGSKARCVFVLAVPRSFPFRDCNPQYPSPKHSRTRK